MEPQVAELFPTPASFTSIFVVPALFLLGKEFLFVLNTLPSDCCHLDSIHQAVTLSVPETLLFRSTKQGLESFVSNLSL